MAITYEWSITKLKVEDETPHSQSVTQVWWEKKGTDEEGNEGIFYGGSTFSAADVAPEDFVAFADLTEEIVLGWVQAEVVDDYEEMVNTKIARVIARKANSAEHVETSNFPWAEQTPVTGEAVEEPAEEAPAE